MGHRCYTVEMAVVVLVLVAVLVAVVAIDGIARTTRRAVPRSSDEAPVSTQKIIVDLTKRR